jgi:hypothetical protein
VRYRPCQTLSIIYANMQQQITSVTWLINIHTVHCGQRKIQKLGFIYMYSAWIQLQVNSDYWYLPLKIRSLSVTTNKGTNMNSYAQNVCAKRCVSLLKFVSIILQLFILCILLKMFIYKTKQTNKQTSKQTNKQTNITDVISYILVSSKFGVWTPWGWQTHAKTCRSSEGLYSCVCHVRICLVLCMNIVSTVSVREANTMIT